jgi:hypothetical protein
VIVFGNKEHGRLIASAIPRNYNDQADHVISRVDSRGKLLGGVIFDGCTGPCIFVHQAAFDKHWLSRDMLWVAFHYPFIQLGCKKLCGTIPSSRPELLDLNVKFGFSVEAIIKDAYPDGDMLVMSMTRDECRWLKLKPRQLVSGS